MAISFVEQPEVLNFALRPLIWKISSSHNYVHSVKVEIQALYGENSSGYKFISYSTRPDIGTSNQFTFDLHEIAQDVVTYTLEPINGSGIIYAGKSIAFFLLVFHEYVETSTGLQYTGSSLIQSDDVFILNAGKQHLEIQDSSWYIIGASWIRRFLTNSPNELPRNYWKPVRMNESEYISGFSYGLSTNPETGSDVYIRVKKINFDGSEAEIREYFPSKNSVGRWDFGVGPENINALSSGFINDNVKNYIVDIMEGTKNLVLSRFYTIDRYCYTDPTRIHFLNRLGGFDSVTFAGTERRKVSAKRNIYQKYLPTTFAYTDRGRAVQSVTGTEAITCFSGALRPVEKIWLEELLTSPAVYIQKNGQYIPVIVKDGSFETKNLEKPTEILKVELEYANPLVLQRN